MKIFQPENNPYPTLGIDVTHRCNMKCTNCYIPNRTIPDMNVEKLYEFLNKLPKRTQIRIIGAEPTMRKDLPDIIFNIKKLGHRPVLLSNGLKLASKKYVKTLKDAGLIHCYISMNGVNNDDWYEKIDELRCADKKIKALSNIINMNMIPNIGCIMQKGVNDTAPKQLINLLNNFSFKYCVIRLKNVGQLGRYSLDKDQNVTLKDMMLLIEEQLNVPFDFQNQSKNIEGYIEEKSRLFPLIGKSKTGNGIWFKLTDWTELEKEGMERGLLNKEKIGRGGRVTEDWKIAPFFEHVKLNEFGY